MGTQTDGPLTRVSPTVCAHTRSYQERNGTVRRENQRHRDRLGDQERCRVLIVRRCSILVSGMITEVSSNSVGLFSLPPTSTKNGHSVRPFDSGFFRTRRS